MPSATRQWGRIAVAKATNAQNALLKPRNLITETPRSDATSVTDARRFTTVRQARRKRGAEETPETTANPTRRRPVQSLHSVGEGERGATGSAGTSFVTGAAGVAGAASASAIGASDAAGAAASVAGVASAGGFAGAVTAPPEA